MRQHQPIAARLRTIEESSNRRVERRIAKAVESSRHAKPTENWELNTCNWVFRIQPDRNGSEGRRHEEDGPDATSVFSHSPCAVAWAAKFCSLLRPSPGAGA